MTQEFVMLPREVVERAIEALRGSETLTYRAQYDIEIDALVDLSAALFDAAHEMLEKDAGIHVSQQPQAVTDCHQSDQPQGEHEPVGEAGPMPGADGFTMACFRASDVSVGTELYTHPLPKRELLTDEEIDKLCPQFDDPMRREMWIIGFKAAHNIK